MSSIFIFNSFWPSTEHSKIRKRSSQTFCSNKIYFCPLVGSKDFGSVGSENIRKTNRSASCLAVQFIDYCKEQQIFVLGSVFRFSGGPPKVCSVRKSSIGDGSFFQSCAQKPIVNSLQQNVPTHSYPNYNAKDSLSPFFQSCVPKGLTNKRHWS